MRFAKMLKTGKDLAKAKAAAPNAWDQGEQAARFYVQHWVRESPRMADVLAALAARNDSKQIQGFVMGALEEDILPGLTRPLTEPEMEAFCLGFGTTAVDLIKEFGKAVRERGFA